MRTDQKYRECPNCKAPNTDGPTRFSNQLRCSQCSTTFCFVHGDAHRGRGCRQFERSLRRANASAEAANKSYINQYTRKCPNKACKARIEKSRGCNHMTCKWCKTDFCWLCGRETPDVEWHYHSLNVFGCPGLHMQGELRERWWCRSNRSVGCIIWLVRFGRAGLALLLVGILLPVVVVLAFFLYVIALPITLLARRCTGRPSANFIHKMVRPWAWEAPQECCRVDHPGRLVLGAILLLVTLPLYLVLLVLFAPLIVLIRRRRAGNAGCCQELKSLFASAATPFWILIWIAFDMNES